MEGSEGVTPQDVIELHRGFDERQAVTLRLLAQHAPIHETSLSICDLVEGSMQGTQAICARYLADGRLDLVSHRGITPVVRELITEQFAADCEIADRGEQPPRFDVADPDAPNDGRLWFRLIVGLAETPLGALCVSGVQPTDPLRRNKGVFYSGLRLLQLAIEQHRAAQNFAATIAAERERIANRLHDEPIQDVTVLSLTLQRIAPKLPATERTEIDRARERADWAIDRMRSMLVELHPAGLDDGGLVGAVELYLEEAMDPIGIAWSLKGRLDPEPDEPTAVLLFRLVHEALANVAAHSGARAVDVEIDNEDGGIRARITDDGHGFDPTAITRRRSGHLGIANVQYLAGRLAGRFDVLSTPGGGCTVDIWLPLDH